MNYPVTTYLASIALATACLVAIPVAHAHTEHHRHSYNTQNEWSYSGDDDQHHDRYDSGQHCQSPGQPQHTVPEPASLALLGIGLIGLGLTRRRKRKTLAEQDL